MKRFATLLALLCAGNLLADEPMSKSEAEARASLALAKAKAQAPAIAAATRPIPLKDAEKLAVKQHKPIFLSVGMDCSGVCGELRPAILTVHEKIYAGDANPRVLLLFPSADGKVWPAWEWKQMPKAEDVKRLVTTWKTGHTSAQKCNCGPGCKCGDDGDDCNCFAKLDALILALTALEPGEAADPAPVGWTRICDAYGCRLVPLGAKPMPVGPHPIQTVYTESYTVEQDASAGSFIAKHPRLARLRSRFRQACGLPPPAVQGAFMAPMPNAEATAATPSVATAVGGGLIERGAVHRLLHIALRQGTLTPEQKAIAEKALTDGYVYSAAVAIAHAKIRNGPVPAGAVGKLGDGTILKLLLDNLPAILADVAQFLKLIHVIP